MKWRGKYKKQGRPPMDWKPPFNPILKRKIGNFIIQFE